MHTPRWKILSIIAVCLIGIAFAMPNLMGANERAWMKANMPTWLPHNTVSLGLDLQGGSHLLMQVDLAYVLHTRLDGVGQSVRPELRKQKIGYTKIDAGSDGILRVNARKPEDIKAIHDALRGVDRDLILKDTDTGVEAKFGDAEIAGIKDKAMNQSIEIVRRRVDETGTSEPVIQRQGDDRIILQLPGVSDPKHIEELLGKTAKLTFQLVDVSGSAGAMTLPMHNHREQTIPLQREEIITGDMLVDAQPSFDSQTGSPIVSFQLNTLGAKRFCDVTRENVNKPFAIVLDREVVSAPNIMGPICGGNAQITGDFTLQEVNDTSLLLRAGALPAPLHVMEERTVGPSLGADSVKAGFTACGYAFVFVIIYLVLIYGLFGVFASFALLFNMVLIIAVMSMLQAVLTLPGIAGIVLTIGLAVDGNVLVFERIKEELREGRSVVSAIDTGYHRAKTTILDSNLTALISSLILFSFGTGPIKGFAVTMSIGVVTSYFCALMLTKLIVSTWLQWKRPKTIAV